MTAAMLKRHETILAGLTVLALIVLALLSDKFFTAENLLNQGRLMSEVGLVALAMTFVIVTGGIDLSVGSILGLTAILLGVFWQNAGMPLPLAMAAALACGTLAGLGNGRLEERIAACLAAAHRRGCSDRPGERRWVRRTCPASLTLRCGSARWGYPAGGAPTTHHRRVKASSLLCRSQIVTPNVSLRRE